MSSNQPQPQPPLTMQLKVRGKYMAPSTKDAGADVKESRMNRYRVGDVVAFEDASEWPPVHMEGPILRFANDEGTYIVVDFNKDHNEKAFGERTLTEDDVTRIG